MGNLTMGIERENILESVDSYTETRRVDIRKAQKTKGEFSVAKNKFSLSLDGPIRMTGLPSRSDSHRDRISSSDLAVVTRMRMQMPL